jgi:hypothetical protein
LTCDFWAENGKRKTTTTATAIESVASLLDYARGYAPTRKGGLKSPHGLAFVKTSDDDDSLRDQVKDVCQKMLFDN